MKYALLTQNKAGTHLCSELLQELGLERSFIHIASPRTYIHYDKNNIFAARGHGYKKFARNSASIPDTLKLVPEESFFHSHMNPQQAKGAFNPFKKVVLTRDEIGRKESLIRWQQETGRTAGLRKGLKNWLKFENSFHLEFKDMIEKNIEKIDALQIFLFGEIRVNSLQALENALNKKTITKSRIRSGDNWNDSI